MCVTGRCWLQEANLSITDSRNQCELHVSLQFPTDLESKEPNPDIVPFSAVRSRLRNVDLCETTVLSNIVNQRYPIPLETLTNNPRTLEFTARSVEARYQHEPVVQITSKRGWF